MPEIIAESIDRLCTIEIRPQAGHTQRGVIRPLYEAARELSGSLPLTYHAAKALTDSTKQNNYVFMITGSGFSPRLPKGEVDGMLGTALLARAINLGLGAKPVLVVENRYAGPLIAATQAAGLPVLDRAAIDNRQVGAIHERYPESEEDIQLAIQTLLNKYEPTAVVAIERPSTNTKGFGHSVNGAPHAARPLAGYLINEAHTQGILTIGVGDGGNEIGMGRIQEAVQRVLPYGKTCRCPCGAGIAAAIATDVLVVANVSNWGAYGIAACLALLCHDNSIFPDDGSFCEVFKDCVRAGALDGISTRQALSDDGIPIEAHRGVLSILRAMITIGTLNLPQHVK